MELKLETYSHESNAFDSFCNSRDLLYIATVQTTSSQKSTLSAGSTYRSSKRPGISIVATTVFYLIVNRPHTLHPYCTCTNVGKMLPMPRTMVVPARPVRVGVSLSD